MSSSTSTPNGTAVFIIACAVVFGLLLAGIAATFLAYRIRRNFGEEDPAMPPVTYHFGQPSFAVYWPRLLNFGRPIPEGTRLFRIQQRMADRFQREEDERLERLCKSYQNKALGYPNRPSLWRRVFSTSPSELNVFKVLLRKKHNPNASSTSASFESPGPWSGRSDEKKDLEALAEAQLSLPTHPGYVVYKEDIFSLSSLPSITVAAPPYNTSSHLVERTSALLGTLPLSPRGNLLDVPVCDRRENGASCTPGMNVSNITGSRFLLTAPPPRTVRSDQ